MAFGIPMALMVIEISAYTHVPFTGTEYLCFLWSLPLFIIPASIETLFILVAKRASIRISEFGILITDWRGREKEIFWHNITGLRTGICNEQDSSILTRDGKRYPIDTWLIDRAILHDEIISKAELTEVRKGWIGITYTRSVA
jgi:hypothetical protein